MVLSNTIVIIHDIALINTPMITEPERIGSFFTDNLFQRKGASISPLKQAGLKL